MLVQLQEVAGPEHAKLARYQKVWLEEEVDVGDIIRLLPGQWLSHPSICGAFVLLDEFFLKQGKRYLFWDAFFLQKLLFDNKGYCPQPTIAKRMQAVMQERYGENTFVKAKVEKLFIPVNVDRVHWTLLVVTFGDEPAMEYFDSLNKSGNQIMSAVQRFLSEMAQNDIFDIVTHKKTKMPRQENGCDCGMFVIAYACSVALGEKRDEMNFS